MSAYTAYYFHLDYFSLGLFLITIIAWALLSFWFVTKHKKKGMGRCKLALARCNIPVARDATTCSHSNIANQDSLSNGHIIKEDTFFSEKKKS